MTLLELHADLGRTATALERIADALERISPPVGAVGPYVPRKTEVSDIGRTEGGERAAIKRLHDMERKLGG